MQKGGCIADAPPFVFITLQPLLHPFLGQPPQLIGLLVVQVFIGQPLRMAADVQRSCPLARLLVQQQTDSRSSSLPWRADEGTEQDVCQRVEPHVHRDDVGRNDARIGCIDHNPPLLHPTGKFYREQRQGELGIAINGNTPEGSFLTLKEEIGKIEPPDGIGARHHVHHPASLTHQRKQLTCQQIRTYIVDADRALQTVFGDMPPRFHRPGIVHQQRQRGALLQQTVSKSSYRSQRSQVNAPHLDIRIFRILKDYGMNHMRFHSWCPPAAAFRMADKLGVYLQVELPMWGKDGEPGEPARWDFFRREQKAILKEYGNHPSFILYCNGNEISGDFDFIEELTRYGREHDSRHLFSGSTARKRVASDQFYTTHQTTSGGATVYEGRPYTDWDICKGTNIDVPVISHETGQRCVYPDYSIIAKFDGPVEARNLEKFRSQLEANGMGDQADDFFRASGAQTVFEYKDVIEAQLRTSTSAGFQLLSINDLPEQGYAPVGILDPFWDSKGLITPEEFRHFCSPTVPLLRFEKRVWNGGETFEAVAEVYNFSDRSLKNSKVSWQLLDEQGKTLRQGKLKTQTFLCDTVIRAGSFSCILPEGSEPQKLTVQLLVGKDYVNSWDIWVYPKTGQLMQSTADVLYTTTFDAVAKQQLQAGKKVVLLPNPKQVKGRRSSFHNHFWNPIMFKWAPMTLGWLIHDDSPVFDHFVTENHPDWQWWDILNYAKVIELQETPQALRPFIQTIDSYDSNRKLGIGFEARVGGGKLLVLALDTQKDMDKRPATCQLLESIDRYVKSEKFNPQVELDTAFIDSFLTTKQTFKK